MFLVLTVTARCSFGKSFNFFFSCSGHSLSCVKDDKFIFSVITVEEIMLCWQPPAPSRSLKIKGFETLMGLWGGSSRWGFRSMEQRALGALCIHRDIVTSLHRAVLASSSWPSTAWGLLSSVVPVAGTYTSCPPWWLIQFGFCWWPPIHIQRTESTLTWRIVRSRV